MSIFLFALWGAQILGKLIAAAHLARLPRWRGLAVWCLLTATKSLYLIYRYNAGGLRAYSASLEAWQPFDFVMGVLLVGCIAWRIAEHFTDAYKVWGVLAVYGAFATALAIGTSGLLAPVGAPFAALHGLARQWDLAMLLTVLGVCALYDGPISVNAKIAKWGLLAFVAGEFVANLLLRLNIVAVGQFVTLAGPLVAVASWGLISVDGERQPPPDPLHGTGEGRLARWTAAGG
jgi:hypothetical protein